MRGVANGPARLHACFRAGCGSEVVHQGRGRAGPVARRREHADRGARAPSQGAAVPPHDAPGEPDGRRHRIPRALYADPGGDRGRGRGAAP